MCGLVLPPFEHGRSGIPGRLANRAGTLMRPFSECGPRTRRRRPSRFLCAKGRRGQSLAASHARARPTPQQRLDTAEVAGPARTRIRRPFSARPSAAAGIGRVAPSSFTSSADQAPPPVAQSLPRPWDCNGLGVDTAPRCGSRLRPRRWTPSRPEPHHSLCRAALLAGPLHVGAWSKSELVLLVVLRVFPYAAPRTTKLARWHRTLAPLGPPSARPHSIATVLLKFVNMKPHCVKQAQPYTSQWSNVSGRAGLRPCKERFSAAFTSPAQSSVRPTNAGWCCTPATVAARAAAEHSQRARRQ